jgi:hypothetical protein
LPALRALEATITLDSLEAVLAIKAVLTALALPTTFPLRALSPPKTFDRRDRLGPYLQHGSPLRGKVPDDRGFYRSFIAIYTALQ